LFNFLIAEHMPTVSAFSGFYFYYFST